MATRTVMVRGEGVTVDLLVWRWLLRPAPGVVEQVLDINPGLAALGPVLPVGTRVNLPLEAQTGAPPVLDLVQLWD